MRWPIKKFLLHPVFIFSSASIIVLFILSYCRWNLQTTAGYVRIKGKPHEKRFETQTVTTYSSTRPTLGGRSRASHKGRTHGDNTTIDGFPVTDFTPHIQQLLHSANLKDTCGDNSTLTFTVRQPFSRPKITCPEEYNLVSASWCKVVRKMFKRGKKQILPNNVSLSISRSDRADDRHENKCFESSAVDGEFCMINFLEIVRMAKGIKYPIIPWENRSSTPIWRGKPWMHKGEDVSDASRVVQDALSRSPRLQVVAWSLEHAHLLDAKIGKLNWLNNHPYWQQREINGMDKLYPAPSFIEQEDYFTRYQVALVLGGIGAAFRTSIHLSTETAVVLQEYRYKEWFTPMMEPFVHYIPLQEDLTDLDEKMRWIYDHPSEVRQIAKNGRLFYERYLSFAKNEEHIYELLYRISLLVNNHGGRS